MTTNLIVPLRLFIASPEDPNLTFNELEHIKYSKSQNSQINTFYKLINQHDTYKLKRNAQTSPWRYTSKAQNPLPPLVLFSSCSKKNYILLRAKLKFSFFLFIAISIQHKTILTQQFSLQKIDLKLKLSNNTSQNTFNSLFTCIIKNLSQFNI